MAQVEQLRFPPITEAVIDFRVTGKSPVTQKDFEPIREALAKDYPIARNIFRGSEGFQFLPIGEVPPQNGIWGGINLASADEKYFATFSPQRCSVSRARPYQNWNHLKNEFLKLWDVYQHALPSASLDQVGLRYFNELEVPVPEKISDIFKAGLAMAPAGFSLGGFASNCLINDLSRQAVAVLRVASQPPGETGRIFRFMVDIDSTKQGPFDLEKTDSWSQAMEDLRNFKNELFFGLLTDYVITRFK